MQENQRKEMVGRRGKKKLKVNNRGVIRKGGEREKQ